MEQIAMYFRLSKEDEFIRDESNSITNQRAFIREYQKLNKEIVDTFVAEIVVHDKERVEIKWKFRDEFQME